MSRVEVATAGLTGCGKTSLVHLILLKMIAKGSRPKPTLVVDIHKAIVDQVYLNIYDCCSTTPTLKIAHEKIYRRSKAIVYVFSAYSLEQINQFDFFFRMFDSTEFRDRLYIIFTSYHFSSLSEPMKHTVIKQVKALEKFLANFNIPNQCIFFMDPSEKFHCEILLRFLINHDKTIIPSPIEYSNVVIDNSDVTCSIPPSKDGSDFTAFYARNNNANNSKTIPNNFNTTHESVKYQQTENTPPVDTIRGDALNNYNTNSSTKTNFVSVDNHHSVNDKNSNNSNISSNDDATNKNKPSSVSHNQQNINKIQFNSTNTQNRKTYKTMAAAAAVASSVENQNNFKSINHNARYNGKSRVSKASINNTNNSNRVSNHKNPNYNASFPSGNRNGNIDKIMKNNLIQSKINEMSDKELVDIISNKNLPTYKRLLLTHDCGPDQKSYSLRLLSRRFHPDVNKNPQYNDIIYTINSLHNAS